MHLKFLESKMIPNTQKQNIVDLQALFEEAVQSNNITLAEAELLHHLDLKMKTKDGYYMETVTHALFKIFTAGYSANLNK